MPQGTEYYNPIIQAMISRAQLDQQRQRDVESAKQHAENLKLQNSKFEQEQKNQDRMFDFHSTQAKAENEHKRAILTNATKQLDAQLEANHLGKVENLRKLSASGVDISKIGQQPGVDASPIDMPGLLPEVGKTPPGMITVDKENIPTQAFPGPEQANQLAFNAAKAHQAGITEANEPARKDAEQRQMDVMRLSRESAERMNAQTNAMHMAVARMTYNLGLIKAQAGENFDTDPNVTNGLFHTGTFDYKSLPAKQRAAYLSAAPPGYQFIDPKDGPKLDAINKVQDILKLGAELANHSYDKDPVGIIKANNPLFKTGEVKEMQDRLEGLAGNIAAAYSREGGKLTEGDIKRSLGNIFDPKLSFQDNQKRIQAADKFLSQDILKPLLTKYSKNPDQLKNILASRGIDPELAHMDNHPNVKGQSDKNNDPLGIR